MMRKVLLAAMLIVIVSAFAVFDSSPAQAQGSIWYAEYFNNATLSGTPVLTRYDQSINFNWGVNEPAPGVGADNFSVRWATDVSLNPGTYRFFALADDNIRVTVDYSQVVINTFNSSQVGVTVQGDAVISVPGVYHIQVDYRESTNLAFAYVSYGNLVTNPQPNFGGGGGGGAPPGNVINTAPWTVQYYNNASLAGDPVAIQSVPSPSFNYGSGSPLPSVPADNWTARFTSVQNLSGGTYNLSVAVDDGVRVYVNGSLVINQFGAATGQTITAQLNLPAGANNFQVEYLEFGGNASLDYRLTQPGTTPPPASPGGATITVNAYRLNVRQLPSATATILTRINRNESYSLLGRNAAGTWYQINVNGTTGWVSGAYVTVNNGAGVPVVDPGSGQPQPTQPPAPAGGIVLTATPYTVNIRSGPGTTFSRIARLPANQTATVVGRNALNQWWQINYNGIVGWVTAQYTRLPAGTNVNSIPVTG